MKKGPTKGSGGKHRNALRGKGPTPKAENRVYHKAYKAKKVADRRKMADPRLAARRRAAKFASESDDLVIGRNAVLEALRCGVPASTLYIAARIEHDDKEWFPYCLELSEKIKGCCNSDEKEALHLGDEQRSEDAIEALLSDLKGIMIKHLSGDYNENLCYAVIFGISSLEKDIKQHNRIRYRILTPMVSAMEKLCK